MPGPYISNSASYNLVSLLYSAEIVSSSSIMNSNPVASIKLPISSTIVAFNVTTSSVVSIVVFPKITISR